jgi:hypothetical protein
MKNIVESLADVQRLCDYIDEHREEQIDESLKDFMKSLKNKFKQVVQFLRGVAAKLTGSYWCPVDEDGNVMNAISPLTASQAYKDGAINKASTIVIPSAAAKRIVGLGTKPKDAYKLYGSGNSLDYWARVYESDFAPMANINEVKMANEDPEARYNVLDTPALMERIEDALKYPEDARLMIWGAPGIGKTAILKSVLDSFPGGKDMDLICKTLSNETPDNFTLPKYVEINGQEKATDVPKSWLPVYKPTGDRDKDQLLSDACGKGLLFIDELSRATPQVLNVMLPLINEGTLNEFKMGEGWTIIVASNRPEDELSGQSDVGNALGNRFEHVYYEPTVHSWKKWAETQNYISPLLIQWLSMPEHENMSGGKFFYMDPNENMDDSSTRLMCTPRSWTNAMRKLSRYSQTGSLEGWSIFDIPKSKMQRILNGCVPASAVDSFIAFLEVISSVGDFDAACRDIWKGGGKSVKIDKKNLRVVALPLAQCVITAHAKNYPTEEEFLSFAQWVADQDSDQLASYVMDIMGNVFGKGLADNQKGGVFIVADRYRKAQAKDPVKAKIYEDIFKNFCAAWGFTMDTIPDWEPGRKLLAKKYGESFSKTLVDGQEALG